MIEIISVAYLVALLLVCGVLFVAGSATPNFGAYIEASAVLLSSFDYGILCFIGAVLLPFVSFIPREAVYVRRAYYVFCSMPLAAFVTPYSLWYINSNRIAVGIILQASFFVGVNIIGWAVFR